MNRTNVLLITLDTVRPDHLGCYGRSQAETPTIDEIAAGGIVFHQAFTNGSYTKPAFPPILSSTYAGMYGGPFSGVHLERPMLARVLRAKGYRTAGFTANPLLGAYAGYQEGFESFAEPAPSPDTRRWLRIKGVQRVLRSAWANSLLTKLGVNTRPHPVYCRGPVLNDLARQFVSARNTPFFLWVHYMDAHWPYHLPEELRTGRQCASAWQDLHVFSKRKKVHPGDRALKRLVSLYDSSLAYLDAQIGELLQCLREHDLLETTNLIFLSDHGEAFYEHGRWQHGAVFDFHEEIVRVPLIIRPAGRKSHHAVHQLVSMIDVAPTILDLLAIEPSHRMEGQSLAPLWNDGGYRQERPVIIEMIDVGWYAVAIRDARYKFIFDERRPDARELYDLVDDPNEARNRFGELPEVEAKFEGRLSEHLQRVRSTSQRGTGEDWEHEDELVRRMRQLGYLD